MIKHCYTCGGYGFEDKECPECHKQKGNIDLFNKEDRDIKGFVKRADFIGIPQEYIGIQWHKDILLADCKDIQDDLHFQRFTTQLEKIHNIFGDGRIPGRSVIICAGQGMSKQTFAFSCMQLALNSGFRVAPLLDTVELKRLIVVSAENPRYRYCNKITIDNYLSSDVLFVTVSKSSYSKEAYMILTDLMDKRTRKGLPTFIISRYSLKEISEFDSRGEFQDLLNSRYNNQNPLKYPTVLSYFK